ncbi:MAG: hypothetical protein HRU20_01245 [Pseudomonadales bacterium]|nr:hypothetical protein [Pseudomonadales bacterium]
MNIEENGFELHRDVLDQVSIEEIIKEIESLDSNYPKHGIRHAEKKLYSEHHVQPDIHVLEDMNTFKIHLDDANERNGCLNSHSLQPH